MSAFQNIQNTSDSADIESEPLHDPAEITPYAYVMLHFSEDFVLDLDFIKTMFEENSQAGEGQFPYGFEEGEEIFPDHIIDNQEPDDSMDLSPSGWMELALDSSAPWLDRVNEPSSTTEGGIAAPTVQLTMDDLDESLLQHIMNLE